MHTRRGNFSREVLPNSCNSWITNDVMENNYLSGFGLCVFIYLFCFYSDNL